MLHTYEITKDANVLVDGKHIIKTNPNLDYYKRETQAYNIIDYISEDEMNNLKEYLTCQGDC